MSAARWIAAGLAAGVLAAAVAAWPAGWIAARVAEATEQRLLLADAEGSVWRGSAVVVLTGGEGSRDASQLPGRLHWRIGLDGLRPTLHASQACCTQGEVRLRLQPGLGRWRVEVLPPEDAGGDAPAAAPGGEASPLRALGQWPASWLAGLGTPWNTLQPRGTLRLSTSALVVESVGGRWVLTGRAEVDVLSLASRVSTLPRLGDYRLSLRGDARGDAAELQLATLNGALQLAGSGRWSAGRLHFRGQAWAAPGSEAVLNNLLNLMGRRQGAQSLIAIG